MYIDRLIWYFLIYAMIGYLVEVAYCSIRERKLVNRGFLHGPWLPIYGIGALLIIISTISFTAHAPLVFIVTVVLTSAVEYIGSWALEQLFGVQLWDYSRYRFNIKGRVCLKNSILFGILGLTLVYLIHPFVGGLVSTLGERTLSMGSHAIILVIAIDTTASVMGMLSFTRLIEQYNKRKEEIEERLATMVANSNTHLLIERLKEERNEQHERLVTRSRSIMTRFPSATSHNERRKGHLATLRARLDEALKERTRDKK